MSQILNNQHGMENVEISLCHTHVTNRACVNYISPGLDAKRTAPHGYDIYIRYNAIREIVNSTNLMCSMSMHYIIQKH
jgi:hypothetical protein